MYLLQFPLYLVTKGMWALDKSFFLFGSNFFDRKENFYQMSDFIGFESAKWAKYEFYDFNCVNGDKM